MLNNFLEILEAKHLLERVLPRLHDDRKQTCFIYKSTFHKKYFLIPVVRAADNLCTLSSLTFIFTESNYKKENHLQQLVKVISYTVFLDCTMLVGREKSCQCCDLPLGTGSTIIALYTYLSYHQTVPKSVKSCKTTRHHK